MALFGQVARLDERNALVTDGAFQVASGQAVELVAQMSDALLRFGVGRRRGKPAIDRGHAGSAGKPNGPCSRASGLEKISPREPALRASHF